MPMPLPFAGSLICDSHCKLVCGSVNVESAASGRCTLCHLLNRTLNLRSVSLRHTCRWLSAHFKPPRITLALSDQLCHLLVDWRSSAGYYAIGWKQHHRNLMRCYRTSHALLLPCHILLAQHDELQHLVDIPVSFRKSFRFFLFLVYR